MCKPMQPAAFGERTVYILHKKRIYRLFYAERANIHTEMEALFLCFELFV